MKSSSFIVLVCVFLLAGCKEQSKTGGTDGTSKANSGEVGGGNQPALADKATTPSGKTISTTPVDPAKQVTSLQPKLSHILEGHSDWVTSVSFSPDGKTLATASKDKLIKLWDVKTGKETATLDGSTDALRGVAFSRHGKMLASGGDDGAIWLWDVATKKHLPPIKGYKFGVKFLAFGPDETLLVLGDLNKVKIWDLKTRKEKGTLVQVVNAFAGVDLSLDGKFLASACSHDNIKIWNVREMKEHCTFKDEVENTFSVAFHPNNEELASGHLNEIKLWDVRTGRVTATLSGHTDAVGCMSFSPDGNTLASGGNDYTMKLWNVNTRKEIGSVKGIHTQDVYSVAWSPDGRTLASGGWDGTAKLWDLSVSNK